MALYVATHAHRHGTSVYLFETEGNQQFSTDDFAKWLDDDYEPDRDDEWLEVTRGEIIKWSV